MLEIFKSKVVPVISGFIIMIPFITAMLVGTWFMSRDTVVPFLKEELGITSIENDIKIILEKIDDLVTEDSILFQPVGLSYVREPVVKGQIYLDIVLYVRRTSLGENCVYKGSLPLFTDDNGVTIVGEFLPPNLQIPNTLTRVVKKIRIPKSLPIGRSTVQLQVEYLCEDKTSFELTYPIQFYYLESKQ